MGRFTERPRNYVVSLRVTDEEWELLQQIKRASLKSISDIMRDSMRLAAPQLQCLCESAASLHGDAAQSARRA